MSDIRSGASFFFPNRRGELATAMTIEFPCPHCATLVRTPDAVAGKKGKCPGCHGIVQIPATNGTAQAVGATKQAVAQKPAAPVAAKAAATKSAPAGAADTTPIEFFCSSCGQVVRTPRALAGKKGKCPHCSEVIAIPLIDKPVAATKLAAPKPAVPASGDASGIQQKKLAVESRKESTKPTPSKAISAPDQPTKPAAVAAPTTPALKPQTTVVIPVPADAPALQPLAPLKLLAPLSSGGDMFGGSDPFATLHQNAAPGISAPTPVQPAHSQSAPQILAAPAKPTWSTPSGHVVDLANPPPLGGLSPLGPVPTPPKHAPPPTAALATLTPLTPLGGSPAAAGGDLFGGSPPPTKGGAALQPLGALTPLGPAPAGGDLFGGTSANANPFGDFPAAGSYSGSPAAAPGRSIAGSIHIPAIIQLVVVIPFLLMYLLYFGGCVVYGGFAGLGMALSDPQAKSLASSTFYSCLTNGLFTFMLMLMQSFVLYGSIRQLQEKSLLVVQISNFLALIPCVSPMGLPSAVWSLVGLYRDEVKRSFR